MGKEQVNLTFQMYQ